MDEVKVTVDGRQLTGPKDMTILELARENGIYIPTLCYCPELPPSGLCRVCVVEVEGSRTLAGSCHTPIAPGMVIHTDSDKVNQTRKIIVELLLTSHAGLCLVCEKANMCELRRLAADLEVGLPRFQTPKRYYPIEDISPYLKRDLSKCILCRRCVLACGQIAKQNIFAMAYRGFDSKVVVDNDQPIDKEVCRDCEICVSLCPTGALSKPVPTKTEKQEKPLVISGH